MASTSECKRKVLSSEEKSNIIPRLANGENNAKLALEFEVADSTISTIWKIERR